MKFMEPGVCRVDVARGELTGATNRYVKTLADLDGLYEDAAAFEALKREWGDEVATKSPTSSRQPKPAT